MQLNYFLTLSDGLNIQESSKIFLRRGLTAEDGWDGVGGGINEINNNRMKLTIVDKRREEDQHEMIALSCRTSLSHINKSNSTLK